MLFNNVEGMTTTSTVFRRRKGSASKFQVPCPDIIKMYNQGIGGVDFVDQGTAAYNLDAKSFIRFYLHIFFDLDVACANSFIACNIIHPNQLTLPSIKTCVSTCLVGRYTIRNRAPQENKTESKRK